MKIKLDELANNHCMNHKHSDIDKNDYINNGYSNIVIGDCALFKQECNHFGTFLKIAAPNYKDITHIDDFIESFRKKHESNK